MHKSSEAVLAWLWCVSYRLLMRCEESRSVRQVSGDAIRYHPLQIDSYLLADNLVWNSKFYGGHFEYI